MQLTALNRIEPARDEWGIILMLSVVGKMEKKCISVILLKMFSGF